MSPNTTFSITAKTCTLKYNNQEGYASILGNSTRYIVPIYQRPYSWKDEQLRKFISDIFVSFWGSERNSIEEPMFIGTMQLSKKNERNEHYIIDGQQRLTTLLIFIKVLKIRFPDNQQLDKIGLDWITTHVNKPLQQEQIKEMTSSDLVSSGESQNLYLRNSLTIKEMFEEQIHNDEETSIHFDSEKFIIHILSNIYFVVIETMAGLSKTLQIFDAINTTGLDLNGGDVFKIKLYEYLRDKKSKDENVFEEINQVYKRIDELNIQFNETVTDITGVLGIYQYILIAKYNLPTTLYSYSTDTFFERLFDTKFNITQWEHFKNHVNNIDLSIDDIQKIIEVRFEWQGNEYKTCEDACAIHFIWWSRYGKYWNLTFVFLCRFREEENHWDKMLMFVRQLSKLYIIYSIRFLKSINEIHKFTYDLIYLIMHGSIEEVMISLNKKIGMLENHRGWGDLEAILTGNIVYNAKLKNIICRLSAMLEEDYKTTNQTQIEFIRTGLFETDIDIEHIQSYNDRDKESRQEILYDWKENINSIGNLMVLEREINQNISNNLYGMKICNYPRSIFKIVKKHCNEYTTSWDLATCLDRKEKEKIKILDYLFSY